MTSIGKNRLNSQKLISQFELIYYVVEGEGYLIMTEKQ